MRLDFRALSLTLWKRVSEKKYVVCRTRKGDLLESTCKSVQPFWIPHWHSGHVPRKFYASLQNKKKNATKTVETKSSWNSVYPLTLQLPLLYVPLHPNLSSWPILTWNLSDERVNILSTVPIVFRLGSQPHQSNPGFKWRKKSFIPLMISLCSF